MPTRQSDLEESVKTGLWKTQRHNQPILGKWYYLFTESMLTW